MNIGATGRAGEEAALEMFLKNGFDLVTRNYQTKCGEIDLIVKNEKFLVFAEVKTRTNASWYKGYSAVTREKKQKLIKTALMFLKDNRFALPYRFDVIEIEGHWLVIDEKEQFSADRIHWFKNAITVEDYNGFM